MSLLSLTIDVACGMRIEDACKETIKLASRIGITIKFEFNGKTFLVFPYTDLDSLLSSYTDAQENNCNFVSTLEKDQYLRKI